MEEKEQTAEVELGCGVYREASVFPIKVARGARVSALQEAIFSKKRYENQFKLGPSALRLYLARKNGEWLKDDRHVNAFLKAGVSAEYEEMRPLWALNDEEYFGESFQPGPKEIHVLVKLPEVPEAAGAKKKQCLPWLSTRRGSHAYDPNSKYFLLEKEDVNDSGLPPVRSILYCRPTFHRQIEFMRDEILTGGHTGWILGPPGTGKSSTAMAFALTLDRSQWIVTWIHVGKDKLCHCVRLIGDERRSRIVDISDVDEVLMIEDTRRHVVLVDGWTAADEFSVLSAKCVFWFFCGTELTQRRLAFVCSVAARGKIKQGTEILTRSKGFRVCSWTLEEYLSAIKDDDMFQSVSQYLDARAGEDVSREAMVESKFYYAGGCCRYMFYFGTATVTEMLNDAVNSLNDAMTITISCPRSSLSINRLQGMFQPPGSARIVLPVISQYAASLIAVKCGPEAIKRIMSMCRDSSNPALRGWMLEMVFFASIQYGGLTLVDAAGNEVDKWGESEIVESDGIPVLSSDHPVWIKPEKWNQGGYDAIMVCKRTQHVRFVQVTSALNRSFRIEYFHGWLKMLSESPESFEVKTLEIIFVVERYKLRTFEFTTVTGEGLLVPFGWPKGKETERVRLLGIRRLNNLSK